jgi:hypothetical protein
MKIGIMQPYFLPYIGYFQLMNHVDKWVVFDDIQYIDKGWINRNRILHPNPEKKWQYIGIPVCRARQSDKITTVQIDNSKKWKKNILGKLTCYKRKAPYYRGTMDLVTECLHPETTNLSDYLAGTLQIVANYLGISTEISRQSHLDLSLETIEHPGQWALQISHKMGAKQYINPSGGSQLFIDSEFAELGVTLRFLRAKLSPYVQRCGYFVPGLSIIDVLMWNSIEEVKTMLDLDYDLLSSRDFDVAQDVRK